MSDEANDEAQEPEESKTVEQSRAERDAALVEERKAAAEEAQADVTQRQHESVDDQEDD